MTDMPERIWITSETCLWPTYRSFYASNLDHSNDEGTYPEYVRADLYDAAQAEIARLTAALAEAETRGAERMREAAWLAAMNVHEVWWRRSVHSAYHAVQEAADKIRALPLPPRERDGQEG